MCVCVCVCVCDTKVMTYEDDITTAHRVVSALDAPTAGAGAPVAFPPLSRASLVLRRMPAAAFVHFGASGRRSRSRKV